MRGIFLFTVLLANTSYITAQRNYFPNSDSIMSDTGRNAPMKEGERWTSDMLIKKAPSDSFCELFTSVLFIYKRTDAAITKPYYYGLEIGNYFFQPSNYPFIQLRLPSKLKEGCTYHFSCKLKISSKSTQQVYLGYSESLFPRNRLIKDSINKIKQIGFKLKFPEDNKEWKTWEETFIANGDETYIFIGNLFPDEEPKTKHGEMPGGFPWLFVDDLKLYAAEGCELEFAEVSPVTNKFILRNLNYGVGDYGLSDASKVHLDSIAEILKAGNYFIEISGYTDSTGNEVNNLQLSLLRADAVKSYFISKGINADEIQTKGKGSTEPIELEKSSLLNRRVEIVISSK